MSNKRIKSTRVKNCENCFGFYTPHVDHFHRSKTCCSGCALELRYKKNPFNNKDWQKQNLDKANSLGYSTFGHTPEAMENRRKTNLKNHGVEYILQKHLSPETIELIQNKEALELAYKNSPNITHLAKELSISNSQLGRRLRNYNIDIRETTVSHPEMELYEFIRSILPENIEIIQSDKTIIKPKHLDILIPSLKIAFEFNGSYFHCIEKREKSNHKKKYIECKEKNIQLIQIWEPDWYIKREIIESMIRSKLGILPNKIYARNCTIKEISSKDARDFFTFNHIQGSSFGKINLGLYHKDILVSVMCFKSSGVEKEKTELNRFCSLLDTQVIGGASKLFKFFTRNYRYNSIVSYSNCDFSDGNLYEKLGFKFKHHTDPNLFFIKDQRIINRQKFMKYKLGLDFDETVKQWLEKNDVLECYGSGLLVWEYSRPCSNGREFIMD